MTQYSYKMGTFDKVEPLFEHHRSKMLHASREAKRDPITIAEHVVPW